MPHTYTYMTGRRYNTCALILIAAIFLCRTVSAEENVEYRKFKLEKADCDVGIMYSKTAQGTDVSVSAIATGKGADFRKWNISDIKIHVEADRIRPDQSDKFYVTEESFFRIPAAVLFAALGTQIPVSGTALQAGVAQAGMAIGLGLLVLAAKGEITGLKCTFLLDRESSEKAFGGKGFFDIELENTDQHWTDTVRIGIVKPVFAPSGNEVYKNMSAADLSKLIDGLGGRVVDLEKEQANYKYGVNPEYDHIQSDIEDLQTQRGIAYKIRFEREHDGR